MLASGVSSYPPWGCPDTAFARTVHSPSMSGRALWFLLVESSQHIEGMILHDSVVALLQADVVPCVGAVRRCECHGIAASVA